MMSLSMSSVNVPSVGLPRAFLGLKWGHSSKSSFDNLTIRDRYSLCSILKNKTTNPQFRETLTRERVFFRWTADGHSLNQNHLQLPDGRGWVLLYCTLWSAQPAAYVGHTVNSVGIKQNAIQSRLTILHSTQHRFIKMGIPHKVMFLHSFSF